MLTTSLNLLREAGACEDRYKHLLAALGGPSIDHDAPIPLSRILDINGLDDCLWALRATPNEQDAERDRKARLFAVWCCREMPLHDGRKMWDLLTDERSRNAVDVAERFANGKATQEELAAAWGAARAAARDAARAAAWDAAWAAAWAAARAAQNVELERRLFNLGAPK